MADTAAFETPITLSGPARAPRNLLIEQTYDGHASLHDGDVADRLGIADAPIEGPTHFSQFEPLGYAIWGDEWYRTGCISAHFRTMVFDGESVTASATAVPGDVIANIDAHKNDDGASQVLAGTMSVGTDTVTALDERLAELNGRDHGEFFILDQIEVGMSDGPVEAVISADERNGDLYPFSLAEKLDAITERSPWFETDDTPWGRPIVPMEMMSVLTNKHAPKFPVRRPNVGLFLDLEVRFIDGPLFVGQAYQLRREVVGRSQSRRVESQWVRTTISDGDIEIAHVLLHSGVFKESYPHYPTDRLLAR